MITDNMNSWIRIRRGFVSRTLGLGKISQFSSLWCSRLWMEDKIICMRDFSGGLKILTFCHPLEQKF